MHETLPDLLRCPFCGTRLSLVDNDGLVRRGTDVESGVLGCECCAFPIVAGIPVLIANDATRDAIHALEANRHEAALVALLGLDGDRADRFRALLARRAAATYREALDILSPDAEGAYFLYRFSDPTYLTAEALVRALGRNPETVAGPVLDLAGGSGHLAWVLAGLGRSDSSTSVHRDTIVADLHFWKLWLASRFTAPRCAAVCCDGEAPLPFTNDLFSMVVLADAFPYIWHKRLCADEMMRVARPDGVVLLPHLHSALGDNVAAGDTLTPQSYQDLFARHQPRLFSDARLLDAVLEHQVIDLTHGVSPTELGPESALTLIACPRADCFRGYVVPEPAEVIGELVVNPLYGVEWREGTSILTLRFPTPEYEAEFGACRRYLPDTVTVEANLTGRVEPAMLGTRCKDLRRQRVLIDVPPRYC
jgi:uncharacterized protein YbaR (Trm112 family)